MEQTSWNIDRFKKRLRQLRSERNLTQVRLAQLLNTTPRVYNRWERGDAVPGFDTIVKIAGILNVSIDELVARKAPKDYDAEIKITNPELHRLYQKVDLLSDEDQKALVLVIGSLLKRSRFNRTIAEIN